MESSSESLDGVTTKFRALKHRNLPKARFAHCSGPRWYDMTPGPTFHVEPGEMSPICSGSPTPIATKPKPGPAKYWKCPQITLAGYR